MKIGIDLLEIARMEKSLRNPRFMARVFTPAEIELFAERRFAAQTVAANFCAKEAFAKALGCGFRGFSYLDIEVLRDPLGAPVLTAKGLAAELLGDAKVSVSMTHTKGTAGAVVIIDISNK